MFASGSPCRVFAAVVPHASNNFTRGECDYLYVGVAGDVTAICSGAVVLTEAEFLYLYNNNVGMNYATLKTAAGY